MLIVGDEGHYNGRFPWVTATLIIINVVVYTAQALIGPAFTLGWALVPGELPVLPDLIGSQRVSTADAVPTERREPPSSPQRNPEFPLKDIRPTPILTLFTSLFLHADIYHLIGNMWFLLVFGRNVECALSHLLFLVFYLACGAAAGLAHVISDPYSLIPCIGASGAISGILGAYISIHPFNSIRIWIGAGIIEVPALIVIGIWFILNYLSAFLPDSDVVTGGVAYWAHLGGFTAGFVSLRTLVWCLKCKRRIFGDAVKTPIAPVNDGGPDPYATFLSVQATSKTQKQ
jgi:membrane associated rhomboid family serine protease